MYSELTPASRSCGPTGLAWFSGRSLDLRPALAYAAAGAALWCTGDISTVNPPVLGKLATRGMINSDLLVHFRLQVQALGGQLSYSDRRMVLPVETSGRLGMG